MRPRTCVGFFSLLAVASAFAKGDLPPEVVGGWSVPSTIPGRIVAVYHVDSKGRVNTVLPKIPDDVPFHLMDGANIALVGQEADSKTGKTKTTYRLTQGTLKQYGMGTFEVYAAAFAASNPELAKQFAEIAGKKGVLFTVEGQGPDRKVVYDLKDPLKSWFPDNVPNADAQKSKDERDRVRSEVQKTNWNVTAVVDCDDSTMSSASIDLTPAPMFEKFAKPGSTLRFNSGKTPPSVDSSADPNAKLSYYASYTERTIGIGWLHAGPDGKPVTDQMKLVDQDPKPGAPANEHHFHVNVGGKCKDIVANNAIVTNGTAGAGGTTGGGSTKTSGQSQ